MKKRIEVLICAFLMTFLAMATNVLGETITVEKGDTLWGFSKKFDITVQELQQLNNIINYTIFVGQELKVSKDLEYSSFFSEVVTEEEDNLKEKEHIVKLGETLWRISFMYDISVQDLKEYNNLNSSLILVGQKLKIRKRVVEINEENTTEEENLEEEVKNDFISEKRNRVIEKAKSHLGTPYKWAGTTPNGFDCSGYIYFILGSESLIQSRKSVEGYWDIVKRIEKPTPGDLVFFENTYKTGPSHMGIYLGEGDFIHASSSGNGVIISNLNQKYYKTRLLGYGTFIN